MSRASSSSSCAPALTCSWVSAGGGLLAIYWLGLGTTGLFVAVACGFCLYAALLVYVVLRVKAPDAAAASA